MNQNVYSDLKIVGFPDKLKSFREGKVTAPIYVRIKPINLCNDHCWWCVYHAPEHSQMHTEMELRDKIGLPKMLEILEDLAAMGVKAVTYSGGGEPLLHNHAAEFMRRTLELGLDLSIITNGQFLKGERADVLTRAKWVRVSIDYADGEQLARFRGQKPMTVGTVQRGVDEFEQRMENLQTFAQMKKRNSNSHLTLPSPPAERAPELECDLTVNFIVHKDNCGRLVEIARVLKSVGVENVRFSPMWVAPGFHEYHRAIERQVLEQLREIQKTLVTDGESGGRETEATAVQTLREVRPFTVNSTYDLEFLGHGVERGCTRCLFMQTVPVIGADLRVYSCHNKAYDASGCIGSIRDRRFSELWFSEEARARFEGLNPTRDCRHQCANDSKVRLMDKLTNMSQDNFV